MIYKQLHNKIITLLAEYGYATVEEIQYIVESDEKENTKNQPGLNEDVALPNSSTGKTSVKQKTYNVLNYLVSKGLITLFNTRVNPGRGYYLPEQTKRILESSGEVNFINRFFPSKYNPTGFFHHCALIKVHLILSNLLGNRLIQFYSEPRLKKDLGLIRPGITEKGGRYLKVCDGEVEYTNRQGEKKRIGIEIELNLKGVEARRKQVKVLYEYATAGKLSAIFIVYNNNYTKDKLKETVIELGKNITPAGAHPPPVFFISLPELITKRGDTETEGLTGNIIKLNTL